MKLSSERHIPGISKYTSIVSVSSEIFWFARFCFCADETCEECCKFKKKALYVVDSTVRRKTRPSFLQKIHFLKVKTTKKKCYSKENLNQNLPQKLQIYIKWTIKVKTPTAQENTRPSPGKLHAHPARGERVRPPLRTDTGHRRGPVPFQTLAPSLGRAAALYTNGYGARGIYTDKVLSSAC